MTTLTIRELRQSWPAAEKALQEEEEIVITRDGAPVAKLIRYSGPKKRRPRFDPEKHMAKLLKISGGKIYPSSDASLQADRADKWERR
jgi:antitoxin (DNA-binding transcriptional repressor) of toxin-antitoxin stability system